jgi:hypothetical protein
LSNRVTLQILFDKAHVWNELTLYRCEHEEDKNKFSRKVYRI